MTDEQWVQCAQVLASAYPLSFRMDDELAMEIWFRALCDLEGERILAAIYHMLKVQEAFPSIAAIRRHACNHIEPIEAWHEVVKAMGDSGAPEHRLYRPAPGQIAVHGNGQAQWTEARTYGYDEPKWSSQAVEKALESVGGMMALKNCKPGGMETLRAQFLKAYQAFTSSDARRETFAEITPQEPQPSLPPGTRPTLQLIQGANQAIGRQIPD
jgi:hypothetical protein